MGNLKQPPARCVKPCVFMWLFSGMRIHLRVCFFSFFHNEDVESLWRLCWRNDRLMSVPPSHVIRIRIGFSMCWGLLYCFLDCIALLRHEGVPGVANQHAAELFLFWSQAKNQGSSCACMLVWVCVIGKLEWGGSVHIPLENYHWHCHCHVLYVTVRRRVI